MIVGVHANNANSGSIKHRQGEFHIKFVRGWKGRLPDNVVDDDGVWGQEEVGETLRDLRELQSRAVENLRQ